jgi:FkbM family methyltransferase
MTVTFEGIDSFFHIADAADVIQGMQSAGQFYELHQLLAHRHLIPAKSTVIDVGANVGNHTIFYARHSPAARVYPMEANPKACGILRMNIAQNLDTRAVIATSHLDIAAGAYSARVRITEKSRHNLGGTRFAVTDNGNVLCMALDELAFEGPISFLKIDVEGMEMEVIAGATRLLANHRPAIAIEVDPANEGEFWAWARAQRYIPIGAFFDYPTVRNYLLIPTC